MTLKENWPPLDYWQNKDTLQTIHQWTQIVGKVRLKTMPWQNHSWHVPLYISSNGFTTSPIPYEGRIFQIDFNFKEHKLNIECSNAGMATMDLSQRTVADFHREFFEKMDALGIAVTIHGRPNEMDPSIPFATNTVNKAYEKESAETIWHVLLRANEIFNVFRSSFIGKASPVHLFWGAFDLAVTRFSGRDAPLHPGGMPNMPLEVMQEAYSKEVSSAGFWFGSDDFPSPSFYAYAYPGSDAFGQQTVQPNEAFWSPEMGEFFLKYEDLLKYDNPEATLMSFLESTYVAAATTSNWNREGLERQI